MNLLQSAFANLLRFRLNRESFNIMKNEMRLIAIVNI